MKKLSFASILILFCAGSYAADDITVVALNDFHGQVQPYKNMVGAGKISAFLQEYRKQYPHTIVVLAGDNYQGTPISNLSLGQVDNEFFNHIGVKYSAIGNHDFDYEQEAFALWNKTDKFSFLAANVIESATGAIVPYAKPYGEIKLANGRKVAFIGLSTLETPETTSTKHIKGLKFTDPAVAANHWVEFLNSRANPYGRPDTVILLTHIPTEEESNGQVVYEENPELHQSEIAYVTQNVKGVSALISGHSHRQVTGFLNKVAVVQAASQGKEVSVLHYDCHSQASCVVVPETINLESATQHLKADPVVEQIVDKYAKKNKAMLSQVVATATEDLGNLPATGELYNIKLSYLIADQLRKSADCDVGLQNTYGIRRSLPAGSVTYGMVYETMPFDNSLTTVKLKGSDLLALIKHSLPAGKIQIGVFAGVAVKVNSAGDVLQVLINGKPLLADKIYSLATLDFMTSGGDGFDFSHALSIHNTNVPIREVMRQAWSKNGLVLPSDWQNIQVVK